MLLPKSLLVLDSSLINLMHPGKTLKLFNQLSRSPLDFPHPAFQNLVHKVPKHASSSPTRLPCPVKGTKSSPMWPTSTIFIPSWLVSLTWSGLEGNFKFYMWYPKSNVIILQGENSTPVYLDWLFFLFLLVLASVSQTFICICQSLTESDSESLWVEYEILHF